MAVGVGVELDVRLRVLEKDDEEDCVTNPSSARIWISVFCHMMGTASHSAEVSVGTTQLVKLLSDSAGMFITILGVGFGAAQTLVIVWPEESAVLQP